MSVVGEALAIVSCVAGLVQAYDAGSRIVRQIKARRQAHGALPPSDLLEDSFEKGKREIQELVSEGNERFGSEFEAGDTTAQLALLWITVQTQNALLERLTMARGDDGVLDFDECVDFSDKGRNDALLALHSLFQRKLEEEMARKRTSAVLREDAAKDRTVSPLVASVAVPEELPKSETTIPMQVRPVNPPSPERRRSKGFPHIFRRSTSGEGQQLPTPAATPEPIASSPAPVKKQDRSSTGNADMRIPQTPKKPNRPSISSQNSKSGRGTSNPTSAVIEPDLVWQPQMSRASTSVLAASKLAPITKYGGCCKYAHQIREAGPRGALTPQNLSFYGEQWVYECKSTKCRFRCRAVKKGQEIDNSVYRCHGLEFRWIFLAKSHVAHDPVSDRPPFVCLICTMLGNDSEVYHGHNELFLHVVSHQERVLGDTPLEGPLVFSNDGVRFDVDFDINLPEFDSPPPTPKLEYNVSAVVDVELRDELDKLDRRSKCSSTVSYTTDVESLRNDPYENPWA